MNCFLVNFCAWFYDFALPTVNNVLYQIVIITYFDILKYVSLSYLTTALPTVNNVVASLKNTKEPKNYTMIFGFTVSNCHHLA